MDLQGFENRKRREREQALIGQVKDMDNEIRVCKACGWRERKDYCIRNQIKVCPRCQGTEVRAMTMDFDDNIQGLLRGRD